MAKAVERRKGTATEHASFTGNDAELTVNTTNKSVHVHDGATAGGYELARIDLSNTSITASITELNYVDGVTSAIQTQLNNKASLSGANFTGDVDVTGTVSADGLTVDGGTDSNILLGESGGTAALYTLNDAGNDNTNLRINAENLDIYTDGVKVFSALDGGDISFYEDTGTTPKLTWDASAESLGIGTSSPLQMVHLSGATDTGIQLTKEGVVASRIQAVTTGLKFGVDLANGDTERMRIDASGNLLVGKTSTNFNTDGFQAFGGGFFHATATQSTANSGTIATLNRKSTDGSIIDFRKDGSTVGSIGKANGSASQGLYISGDDVGLSFEGNTNNAITPYSADTGDRDAAVDLGSSSARFKDLYLSGNITSVGIYNNTSGGSANLGISSSGEMYRSTSSLRYKTDVTDAIHGLDELLSLRPVTYRDINGGETVYGGLIAEEVHDAGLTEFVEYNDDGEPDALAYANMVSLCIKAIQDQQETINELKARIETLENK
jgi:hypothetical protein